MEHVELKREMIAVCNFMNDKGVNQGTSGNVSARTDEGFLITASGIPYKKMKPHHVVEMDLDGGYRGDFLPSTEWRMHLDIFRNRPEAKAIVHTHSTYCTSLSIARMSIPAIHYMIAHFGGGHATLVRADPAARAATEIFQPQPAALAALSRRVKAEFDPKNILNPGRMG